MVRHHNASCHAEKHVIYMSGWIHIMTLQLTLACLESIGALGGLASAKSGFHCVGHAVMLGSIYPHVRLARTYDITLCGSHIC